MVRLRIAATLAHYCHGGGGDGAAYYAKRKGNSYTPGSLTYTYGTFIYVRTRVYTLKWRHVRALMRGAARKVLSNHRNTASYGAINFFSLRSNKFSARITSAIHLYFIWLMKIEILSAKKKVLKSEDCSYIVEISRRQLVYLRSLPQFLYSGSVFRFFFRLSTIIFGSW